MEAKVEEVIELLRLEDREAKLNGEQEVDYYFTFGVNSVRDHGVDLSNCYVKFHGTFSGARMKCFERFGRHWAFQYVSAEAAGKTRYNLTEYQP